MTAAGGHAGPRQHRLVVGQGCNAFSYGGDHLPTSRSRTTAERHNTSVTVGNGSEAGAVGNHKLSTAFGNGQQRQNNGLGG